MVTGCNVETPLAAPHRGFERVAVAQVADGALEFDVGQTLQIASRPEQRFHPVTARDQFMHKVRPDKARRAGDETIHKSVRSLTEIRPRCETRIEKIFTAGEMTPGP